MKVVAALVLISVACVFGSPIENVGENIEGIEPHFNAERDVRIMLSTRNNRNNPQRITFRNLQSIQQSHFSANRQTRFLVHGWFEDDTADINTQTSAELLNAHDFNVIFIDWSEGSRTINYIGAANRVPAVGQLIASQIDFMHENRLLEFNRLTVVGFSLGAHIAGMTGKNVRRGRINALIGLDPAGPLFSVRNSDGRIDAGDAQYVECLHTNGPTIVLVGAGIGAPIGHADFFANGGSSQPGCLTNTCSHGRAVDFYVESIRSNRFYAPRCQARDDITQRRCTLPGTWMGGDWVNFSKSTSGSFYLQTNRNSPFAQGPTR